MSYSVHIGFGFHVNCYHSYRGDTCDTLGFGGDIRIIRKTIATLNRWNERGVPVKGTWDFENAYSLEEILPKYAPDIIEKVRLRQEKWGDENILMGYNNGAMSAMTEDEFMASIEWAVTNQKKSGLMDIFGDYKPIIRPQEVMFTPSQAAAYKKAGIEAVCLYYSCIPFDAFRTVIPALSDEQAFNPLYYRYGKDSIKILPMYSQADIMDAGSLRHLVTDLYQKQQKGDIGRDIFLFVNMDADSFLWEPFPVPEPFHRISCFGGLDGLIREVADLPFITFDTPWHYLENHEPAGEISFGEDVADGNFSGYASWAEKPFNRKIWTRLERTRMYAKLYEQGKAPSYEERVRLLSTTHFGLASPVLNVTREQTALALSERMICKEETALCQRWEQKKHKVKEHEVWIKNVNNSSLVGTQLKLEEGFCKEIAGLKAKGKHLQSFVAVPFAFWEDGSVKGIYLLCRFDMVRRKYKLHFKIKKHPDKENQEAVVFLKDAEGMLLERDTRTAMPRLYTAEHKPLALWNSRITYDYHTRHFEQPVWEPLSIGGNGQGVMLSGEIHIKGELEPGTYQFAFFTMEKESGIYQLSRIRYPYTEERDTAASSAFNLGRCYDISWQETMPMELSMQLGDEAVVEKRNFMEEMSGYPLADFWRAYPANENMDSFNHHLTGGLLMIYDEQKGLMLAHARQVLGSMAHCPMRLKTPFPGKHIVSLNPFGTYDGRQRFYPSRGNGCMTELYESVMPQARSLAPAYNGALEISIQQLADYYGSVNADSRERPDAQKLRDMLAFADGCVVYATNGAVSRWRDDNVILHGHRKAPANVRHLRMTGMKVKSKSLFVKAAWHYIQNKKSFL